MGWIAIDRAIMNNPLWKDKPFSKGQAWIDLLLLANYEDKETVHRGELVTCKRGDVNLSLLELSKRWGWNRQTTKNFISLLESQKMLAPNITTRRTTLTIVNYDKYQTKHTTDYTTERATVLHETGQQNSNRVSTTKQYNNINNTNNYRNNDNNNKDLDKYIFNNLDELREHIANGMSIGDYMSDD